MASSTNPKIINWAKPEYPEMARRAQIEGTVIVKVLVGPDGTVKQALVLQGVNPLLNNAAIEPPTRVQVHPGQAAEHPGEGLDGPALQFPPELIRPLRPRAANLFPWAASW